MCATPHLHKTVPVPSCVSVMGGRRGRELVTPIYGGGQVVSDTGGNAKFYCVFSY